MLSRKSVKFYLMKQSSYRSFDTFSWCHHQLSDILGINQQLLESSWISYLEYLNRKPNANTFLLVTNIMYNVETCCTLFIIHSCYCHGCTPNVVVNSFEVSMFVMCGHVLYGQNKLNVYKKHEHSKIIYYYNR